jgi:hypothetical protein
MVMEMIGNYWLAVAIGLLIGGSITASGMYALGFRRVHRGGRTLLVPEIDRRPLSLRLRQFRERFAAAELRPWAFKAIIALMALAVAAGLVQSTRFAWHQRECNEDFVSTSLELRRIAAEDRALEAQDDALRNQRDDAMTALVETLLTPPAPGERVDSRAALDQWWSVTHPIDVQRDQLTADRADLERQRREQPPVRERC